MLYRVTWKIDIEAPSATVAAMGAEEIMLDYSSDGHHRPVFDVCLNKDGELGPVESIDLEDEPLCAECGEAYFTTGSGVTHHVSVDSLDGIDYDADRDHTAYE